jgi:hypothetical protein
VPPDKQEPVSFNIESQILFKKGSKRDIQGVIMKKKIFSLVVVLPVFLLAAVSGCSRQSSPRETSRSGAKNRGRVTKAYEKYFGLPKVVYPDTTYYVVFYPYSDQEPFLAGKVKPLARETDIKKGLPGLAASKLLQEPPLNDP